MPGVGALIALLVLGAVAFIVVRPGIKIDYTAKKLLFGIIAIVALLLLIVATVVNVECLYGAIVLIVLFTITYVGNVAICRWQKEKTLKFTITVAICVDVWLIIMMIFKQTNVPATGAIGFTLGIILMGSAIKAWFIQKEP